MSATYKIQDLLKRISPEDTLYVVNFWASWCKPCVQELPALDSLNTQTQNTAIKVLLVCLDFSEELNTKVIPFLKKKNIQSECVLLDEVNGNDYINKISTDWSGAIPVTYFKYGSKNMLIEKKLQLKEMEKQLNDLKRD
ncbi:MAG: TlpA family protein disulfide reductase [Bacteroidia bacterium]|nr:TlpA family protein disulfide reductase [Bacteroidia bacterium]